MQSIFGRFRLLLLCLIGLGLTVGPLFGVSLVVAQSSTAVTRSAPSLQALVQEGEANCLQPPANVNLLTLSDAQLVLYGLPPHAVINQNPAAWEAQLAHARHRICASSPATSGQQAGNGPASTQMANVTESKRYSPRWGGNGAYGARGTYHSVSAEFYVPSVQPSNLTQNSTVSFWVGLGGDQAQAGKSSWELIQAGITIQIGPGENNPTTQSTLAFWENEGTSGNTNPQTVNLSIKTNDQIYSEVDSNFGGSGDNYYYVGDNTNGKYLSHDFSTYFSDSATGECIGEVNSSNLADFGKEEFYGCTVLTNSTSNTINNWNHYYYVPTTTGTSSGKALITCSSINSGGDFTLVWESGAA
jgi:hypothetical protein